MGANDMNTANNRRAQATRQRIQDVFLALLQAKDISKISVQEICRGAQINRTTFYTHYQDIYDLFDRMEADMSQRIVDIFFGDGEGTDGVFDPRLYTQLFSYIQENEDFYRTYLGSSGGSHTISLHLTEYGHRMLQAASQQAGSGERDRHEYHVSYFNAGVNALIRQWLATGCRETPEELTDIFLEITRAQLFG